MKRCVRCVLPETFPGIQLDEEQVCQFCRQIPDAEQRGRHLARLVGRFERLSDRVRQRPGYHCVVSWSGGWASTYALYVLRRRYDLRVLAFTLDNGFLAPSVFSNTRRISEHLDIDHVIIKPRFELLRRVFVAPTDPSGYPPKALERGSSICNSCAALIRGAGLRLALEYRSPMLAYGWQPGQIPLASACYATTKPMLQAMIQSATKRLAEAAGDKVCSYFPEARQLELAESLPVSISPLVLLPYDADEAEREIRAVGWEPPTDFQTSPATCLLCQYANQVHLAEQGFHPCVMELATMVREGLLERDEALKRLKELPVDPVLRAVEVKLGLYPGTTSCLNGEAGAARLEQLVGWGEPTTSFNERQPQEVSSEESK